MLLLGAPGSGKSACAKALGNETGRPTLMLDVGSLMGSLIGQTEERTRQALRIADAMAPCVIMIDELEKALSGVGSTGDSGVSSRMFGTLLTYLSDHESDVFIVASANDISKLPPELSRAERFDAVFFLDLPGHDERRTIWRMYIRKFGLDPDQRIPQDRDWVGAEIRSCCRLAALLDVPADRGRVEHRAGGGDGRRGGGAAQAVGQRAVPVGRAAGDLLPRRLGDRQPGPERQSQRPVRQLKR